MTEPTNPPRLSDEELTNLENWVRATFHKAIHESTGVPGADLIYCECCADCDDDDVLRALAELRSLRPREGEVVLRLKRDDVLQWNASAISVGAVKRIDAAFKAAALDGVETE